MRLIAFGCSNTYGHGLVDCFIPPGAAGPIPSKFAWPQLVANELNMDCINMALPGSSNKEILNTLLNFKFDVTDVVIVMWAYIERWCILNDDTSVSRIAWSDMRKNYDLTMQYDKIFTLEDLQIDFIYRANFAKMYLDNKNLKNYHLSAAPIECCPKVMPVWNAVNISKIDLTYISQFVPRALDAGLGGNTGHPGPEAHQIVAAGLIEELSDAHNK
jgi:hypothetical protein